MRYSKSQNLIISEDDSSIPKSVRFQEKDQLTLQILSEVKTGDINLPASITYEIPLGAIGQAEWFYLYSSKDFSIKLDDGPAISLRASKPNELWAKFTKIEVVTTDVTRLTYAIGGE